MKLLTKVSAPALVIALWILGSVTLSQAQSQYLKTTIVVNGRSGTADVYRIDGKSFIDIESLARIANGTISFRDDRIVLTLPFQSPNDSQPQDSSTTELSNGFMRSSVDCLGSLKEWTTALVLAATRGIPGDGSRMVILQNRATTALHSAEVEIHTDGDRRSFELLSNHLRNVQNWNDKLIGERRSMDTAKYSIKEDALKDDLSYQKISKCSDFLKSMIPSGRFRDDLACR